MRFLCITDVHAEEQCFNFLNEFLSLKRYDACIIAGDLTTYGPLDFAERLVKYFDEKNIPLYCVHGNVDSVKVKDFLVKSGKSIHLIKEKVNGINLVGLGGSTTTGNNTIFEYTEDEVQGYNLQEYIDEETIIVSHCPPYGTKADKHPKLGHVGSKVLRKVIEKKRPLACISGHVHENEGTELIGSAKIVKIRPLMLGRGACLEWDDKEEEITIEYLKSREVK